MGIGLTYDILPEKCHKGEQTPRLVLPVQINPGDLSTPSPVLTILSLQLAGYTCAVTGTNFRLALIGNDTPDGILVADLVCDLNV